MVTYANATETKHDNLGMDETTAGTPITTLLQTVQMRMRAQGPTLRKCAEVRERYYGEWILPDLESANLGNLAPAIVADTIDHTGMRAAEVTPMTKVPQLVRGDENSRRLAMGRKKLLTGAMHDSGWVVGAARAFRHYAAYGSMAWLAAPDFDCAAMRYRVRDPLGAFPDPRPPEDLTPPNDIGLVYAKSASWLRSRYPKCRAENGGPVPATGRLDNEFWDVVQWWDCDVMVLAILGPRIAVELGWFEQPSIRYSMQLSRVPNRIGFVPASVPVRVSLDRVASQVSNVLGQVDVMARFAALDMLSSEKAIFADKYILGSQPGVAPTLVGGQWKDGRTGEINLIYDANLVGELRGTPDASGKVVHDRMERNARTSAGLIPQQVGESYGSLRSGRQIDALAGVSIDPRILEMHNVQALAQEQLNRAILAGYKAYWGSKTFYLYSGATGDDVIEVKPDEIVETMQEAGVDADGEIVEHDVLALHNAVEYPVPGTDLQGTTIALGQMLAAKVISREEFADRHPWIPDSDISKRSVFEEQLVDVLTGGLLKGIDAGTTAVIDVAEVLKHYRKNGDEVEAILEADKLARERQAAAAPPPGPDQTTSPEAQPGLAPAQTAGAESKELPPDTTFKRTDRQAQLRQLVLALKTNPEVRA